MEVKEEEGGRRREWGRKEEVRFGLTGWEGGGVGRERGCLRGVKGGRGQEGRFKGRRVLTPPSSTLMKSQRPALGS